MTVTTRWAEVWGGRALFLKAGSLEAALMEQQLNDMPAVRGVVISMWEGMAGMAPSRMFGRWRWNRGAKRLHRDICKAIAGAEEARLSA